MTLDTARFISYILTDLGYLKMLKTHSLFDLDIEFKYFCYYQCLCYIK